MGHAESPVADAAADTDQFDIGMGIRDVDFSLFHAARREETCRRYGKGTFTGSSQTSTDADQVLFSNADFYELVTVFFGIRAESTGTAGVTAKDNDIFIYLGFLTEEFCDYFLNGFAHNAAFLSSSSFIAVAT